MRFSIKDIVGNSFMFLVLFNGVIVSLIKYTGINFGISPINIFTILFFPFFLFYFVQLILGKLNNPNVKILLITLYTLLLLKIFFLILESNIGFTDIMVLMLYYCGILSFYFYFKEYNYLFIYSFLSNSFLIIALIYFIQFFFHSQLPSAFTEIPNLFNEVGVEKYTRELEDIVIYRANGLIGNPITMGFYLNLILSIELFQYNKIKRKQSFIKICLIAIMIIMLFSRANILFCFALLGLNFIFQKGLIKTLPYILFGLLLLIISVLILYDTNPYITFMIDRFTGEDTFSQASNNEHMNDYTKAINVILENPIFGIPPGTRINTDIITDGAIFILLLDLGLICFISLVTCYAYLLYIVKRKIKENRIFAPQFIFILLLIPISILNSAVLNKGMFIITCIYLGAILNFSTKKMVTNAK